MELTRRSFAAMLSGVFFGAKAIGPVPVEDPRQQFAADRCYRPVGAPFHGFIPLQAMAAATLEVVHEEIAWLRMTQMRSDWGQRIFGDTVRIRQSRTLRGVDFDEDLSPRNLMRMTEKVVHANLTEHAYVSLPVEDYLADSWENIRDRYVVPNARQMAENIIRSVRHKGGADYLVSAEQQAPPGIPAAACVLRTSQDSGLTIRAFHEISPVKNKIHIDMLYGLA